MKTIGSYIEEGRGNSFANLNIGEQFVIESEKVLGIKIDDCHFMDCNTMRIESIHAYADDTDTIVRKVLITKADFVIRNYI